MKNGSVKIQDAEIAKYNAKGCFPYGNKIHIISLGKKLIVTDRARIVIIG